MEQLLNHPMVQSVMVWVGLGLATGVAAKILMPGSENMGWIRTILFGLLGSFIGNNIFPRFLDWPTFSPISLQGLVLGVGGAFLLVLLNRLVTRS